MKHKTITQSLSWMHTWSGLLFGWVLFAIFLTGTIAVFDKEIDGWMRPEIPRHDLDQTQAAQRALDYLQANHPGASAWNIGLPGERSPGLSVSAGEQRRGGGMALDPTTGDKLDVRETAGGSFFFRFHFTLNLPRNIGIWVVGLAAMAMLAALVSGIVIHKKFFKEFFTFRPAKGQRSWLDAHNATAVLVLPFHLMISYSSLVIFMYMVMPAPIIASYDNEQAYFSEVFGGRQNVAASGEKVALQPLPELYQRVLAQAPDANIIWLDVQRPGDRNAQVLFIPDGHERIAVQRNAGWRFNGADGSLEWSARPQSVASTISGGFYGLHMASFAGPLLRWLYFFFGLAGTAVIGTGLVMWLGKRQLKHAKSGVQPFELRLVEVLNIASMSGLVLGVAAFFWANRLLPVGLDGRAQWEVNAFFGVWLLSLLHAVVRPGRRAWGEQLALAALAWAALPVLNALTTGLGLNQSIPAGDWAMAGFDLTALGCGVLFAWTAGKMLRAPVQAAKRAPKPAKAAPAATLEAGAS